MFSGMWGGGSPGGMGVMAGGNCVMMCSGADADGLQVRLPLSSVLLLLLLLLMMMIFVFLGIHRHALLQPLH